MMMPVPKGWLFCAGLLGLLAAVPSIEARAMLGANSPFPCCTLFAEFCHSRQTLTRPMCQELCIHGTIVDLSPTPPEALDLCEELRTLPPRACLWTKQAALPSDATRCTSYNICTLPEL